MDDADGGCGSWNSEETLQGDDSKRAFQRNLKFRLQPHCHTQQPHFYVSTRSVRGNTATYPEGRHTKYIAPVLQPQVHSSSRSRAKAAARRCWDVSSRSSVAQ